MTKIRKGFFRYDNVGMLFVLPAFIYMISFVGYPIIYNFILSLQNVTVKNLRTGQHEFVAFKNYIDLFTHDDVLVRSIVNTLVFTVACLIFQFLIGFALALFLTGVQAVQACQGTYDDTLDDTHNHQRPDFQVHVQYRRRHNQFFS